jgi:hypothetical protein
MICWRRRAVSSVGEGNDKVIIENRKNERKSPA